MKDSNEFFLMTFLQKKTSKSLICVYNDEDVPVKYLK